jgi:hypothetical protein
MERSPLLLRVGSSVRLVQNESNAKLKSHDWDHAVDPTVFERMTLFTINGDEPFADNRKPGVLAALGTAVTG